MYDTYLVASAHSNEVQSNAQNMHCCFNTCGWFMSMYGKNHHDIVK